MNPKHDLFNKEHDFGSFKNTTPFQHPKNYQNDSQTESKLIEVEKEERIPSDDISTLKKYIKILNRKVKGI